MTDQVRTTYNGVPVNAEVVVVAAGGGGGGGGDASAANQTATQAAPGSNSTKADGVQGITGGKPVAVAGRDSTATDQVLRTDTKGGLLPPVFQYLDSQIVTLTANTAAQIDSDVDTGTAFTAMTTAQRNARLYFSVQLQAAATADVFIGFGGQGANTNATHFSYRMPAGTLSSGLLLTPPGGTTGTIYAFCTAAASLKVSSQIAV